MNVIVETSTEAVNVVASVGRGGEALCFKFPERLQFDVVGIIGALNELIVLFPDGREFVAAVVVKELELSSEFVAAKDRLIDHDVRRVGVIAALCIEAGINR